jgi:DNA polymerase III epsilon subunit-like protein
MDPDPSKLVFIDIETGGPNPNRHTIIQVAAVAVDAASFATLESIEIKITVDERRATKYALRKNSYSRRIWQDEALSEREAARTFAKFLKRHATHREVSKSGAEYRLAQLVAHNADFDLAFLVQWFKRLRMFLPARRQTLCTLQRCLWHFVENPSSRPQNFRLHTLCKHFGVAFSAADAHDALGDVRATVELYRALVAQKVAVPYSVAA